MVRHASLLILALVGGLACQAVGDEPEQNLAASLAKTARASIVTISSSDRDRNPESGVGTGFFISPDGLVATNLHVIGEGRPISVFTSDGQRLAVTHIHAWDRNLDLAILRVKSEAACPTLELWSGNQVEPGEPVVVLGHPQGLRYSVVQGVISGQREFDGVPMLQLAIPVEPGNSGGPVLNADGKVLGVVTLKSAVTANLGFASTIVNLRGLIDHPNSVPFERWIQLGRFLPSTWRTQYGSDWRYRSGQIVVNQPGDGFGGRSLCLTNIAVPEKPYEISVSVKLDNESGAAGLAFLADDQGRHYGFYPSGGKLRLTCFQGPDVYSWNILHDQPVARYRPNTWNKLAVRIYAQQVQCLVNGQLVVSTGDIRWSDGAPGLAKFRQTGAWFKGFHIRKLEETATSENESRPWEKLLGGIAVPENDSLRDLTKALGDRSPDALRETADELRRRADLLEQLAHDAHVASVCRDLEPIVNAIPDAEINLADAALVISRLDNEDLDTSVYGAEIERMAAEIRQALPADADESTRRAALDRFLFVENGFHGSRTGYYHQANSYLDRVIDDREGLPISLSVLYIELAKRLNLVTEGVGLPGHFLVRWIPTNSEPVLIDPFHQGKELSRDDVRDLVQRTTGEELQEQHLKGATNRQVLVRVLQNLLGLARHRSDSRAVLAYLDALLTIDPESVEFHGTRAFVRYELGQAEKAIADLDWIIENRPGDVNLEEVKSLRQRFED